MATDSHDLQSQDATSVAAAGAGGFAPSERTPPLESGDRLTRAEFERRWELTPELRFAELLEGIVFLQAPISHAHGKPHGLIATWAGMYAAMTTGVEMIVEPSVRMGDENMPQPDALLRIASEQVGHSKLTGDGYLEGGPELVAEIAASSASRDMHVKREIYRAHGVQEYLVWRVYDREIDWFELRDGQYEPLPQDADGLVRSRVFPGLWLDRAAMLVGDGARVVTQLQLGMASAERAGFVARLAASALRQ